MYTLNTLLSPCLLPFKKCDAPFNECYCTHFQIVVAQSWHEVLSRTVLDAKRTPSRADEQLSRDTVSSPSFLQRNKYRANILGDILLFGDKRCRGRRVVDPVVW